MHSSRRLISVLFRRLDVGFADRYTGRGAKLAGRSSDARGHAREQMSGAGVKGWMETSSAAAAVRKIPWPC